MRFWHWIFLCFTVVCLSSCGFQLRGSAPLSPPLKILYIQTADPYGQLTRNLRDYLTMSGVELTDTPSHASTILHIINETQSQQLLSVSGTQQTRQYSLVLAVTFEILNPKGSVLMPPTTLSENRTFTTLSDQILGGTNEQNTLYQQMRIAIIYDIMSRLSSREVTKMLMEPKKHP
ncbi:MAG TPA: LPS assembly lipoprotein LptE [Gammaproteobacteria bacterium]|nr:LPS assembly lipoprotein LptE [Gammaproteobacteria bacterium]